MSKTFDYSKLRGRIREKFKTESAFGTAIGLSHNSLSKKLNGKIMFVQNEIDKAIVLLEIPDAEISTYFFTEKVQETEQ
jgi:hypothetical protein